MSGYTSYRRAFVVQLAALIVVATTGCGSSSGEGKPGAQVLVVFAPSSATEAVTALASSFESLHPNVSVRLNFGGTQTLATQLEHGARAHVFLSASDHHMRALHEAGLVLQPEVIARNHLALIVPRDNPANIRTFSDITKAKRLVIGADQVPVGSYTQRLIANAFQVFGETFGQRVRTAVVSKELNVRLVRAKVLLGEADGALVYRSDVLGQSELLSIPIPEAVQVPTTLEIAKVSNMQGGERADNWLAYLRSAEAQELWARHGFEPR